MQQNLSLLNLNELIKLNIVGIDSSPRERERERDVLVKLNFEHCYTILLLW